MQVNSSLQVLPWYNYPLITFLESYIKPSMNIFEFGTGFSTIFYAQNNCKVFGVECNQEWIEKVQELAKMYNIEQNISIEFCQKSHEIARYLAKIDDSIVFNAIVIDSYNRIECLEEAKKRGAKVIILDNSERPNLEHACEIMQGFEVLHFKGEGPNRSGVSESLVFHKNLAF
jgi:hypothetical protein